MRTEWHAATVAAALLAAGAAFAQPEGAEGLPPPGDAPPPPRLTDPAPSGRAGPRGSLERPNAARLAPLPEELEEVVVVGDPGWRLPDLGTTLRLEREEREAREARIQLTYLPPPMDGFDPTDASNWVVNPEARRVGFINLFRIRFGRR